MSALIDHAKFELELQGLFSDDGDFYGGETGRCVMELIEVFSKQGHSGTSASLVVELFSKLANFGQLGFLTGKDEEWVVHNYGEERIYQNKRNSAVFKHEDGTVTYNEAIIKRCPNGTTWTGPLYATREDAVNNVNRIRVAVREFPFVPKKFYIDVIEEEIEKDDWIMWVKDPEQLKELFSYYKQIK